LLKTELKHLFLEKYKKPLTNSQAKEMMNSLLSMTKEELDELEKDKKQPFWVSM